MKRERITPVIYPIDKRGEPVSAYELGFLTPWESPELPRNNHHLAFMARIFGASAIANAYRNLQVMQEPLVIDEHTFLHRAYAGIKPPNEGIMLDRIQEQLEEGNNFQEPNKELGGYVLRKITHEDIEKLEGAYRGRE